MEERPNAVRRQVTKIRAQVEGTAWAMPRNQFPTDGINPSRSRPDRLTLWRVNCFGKLSANTLPTRDLMLPHSMVEVPLVQGGFCQIPYKEVTAKEWCRMMATEVAHSRQAKKRDAVLLAELTLVAARRLVLHVRLVTADETRPGLSGLLQTTPEYSIISMARNFVIIRPRARVLSACKQGSPMNAPSDNAVHPRDTRPCT